MGEFKTNPSRILRWMKKARGKPRRRRAGVRGEPEDRADARGEPGVLSGPTVEGRLQDVYRLHVDAFGNNG